MKLAIPACVLAVCLAIGPTGGRAAEGGTPPARTPRASTPAATGGPERPRSGVALAATAKQRGASATPALATSATAATAPRAASAQPNRPPPAVLFVPLLGGVLLPFVVPTALPHARPAGTGAETVTEPPKEKQP